MTISPLSEPDQSIKAARFQVLRRRSDGARQARSLRSTIRRARTFKCSAIMRHPTANDGDEDRARVPRAGLATCRHGARPGARERGRASRVRGGRRHPRLRAVDDLLRWSRGRADADEVHPAGDPHDVDRRAARARGARARVRHRGGALARRVDGAGGRRRADVSRRREARASPRDVHAGGGARRRRRDGRAHGPRCRRDARGLREGVGTGRARRGGEPQRRWPDRDLRSRGGHRSRDPRGQGRRRQARDQAVGQRAVPLLAHAARRRSARRGTPTSR